MERNLVNDFRRLLELVSGECIPCRDIDALRRELQGILTREKCRTAACSHHALVKQAIAGISLESAEPSEANVGITGADALIAETGTVAVVTDVGCPRTLLFLPPLHIVVAETIQIVPDLASTLEIIAKRTTPWSSFTLITGPSRTADIEKILIRGVHGPKKLCVLLLESPPSP
ncbi:MAG: hypothetical protein A2Z34_00975 [Planctomycetes bacterium RBG_16_59_8]|nr:MAG: hypothetical protein A2Z34_00975 [Planctomycetes bacterium RBG_16_59_8]